jgi:hypothetical protein
MRGEYGEAIKISIKLGGELEHKRRSTKQRREGGNWVEMESGN